MKKVPGLLEGKSQILIEFINIIIFFAEQPTNLFVYRMFRYLALLCLQLVLLSVGFGMANSQLFISRLTLVIKSSQLLFRIKKDMNLSKQLEMRKFVFSLKLKGMDSLRLFIHFPIPQILLPFQKSGRRLIFSFINFCFKEVCSVTNSVPIPKAGHWKRSLIMNSSKQGNLPSFFRNILNHGKENYLYKRLSVTERQRLLNPCKVIVLFILMSRAHYDVAGGLRGE